MIRIRGETNIAMYEAIPANIAFYDLTPDKRIPRCAKNVLGLNLKFIPTPSKTTGDLSESFSRFKRDMHLKTFFAVEGVTAADIRAERENLQNYISRVIGNLSHNISQTRLTRESLTFENLWRRISKRDLASLTSCHFNEKSFASSYETLKYLLSMLTKV